VSVRASHAGFESKPITVGSCDFPRRVAHRLEFLDEISYGRRQENLTLTLITNPRGLVRHTGGDVNPVRPSGVVDNVERPTSFTILCHCH